MSPLTQTFSLEPSFFARFIRLEFDSHYGSEFYCPVSQVKVYGMNQLESFKWEQRQAPEPPSAPPPVVRLPEPIRELDLPEIRLEPNDTRQESIYATITRRLDEQMRVLRALNASQSDLSQWRARLEQGEQSRLQQERMRQEDRLGALISRIEQQRARADMDREHVETQLGLLAEQLAYEQRRSIAQLVILMVVIAIGFATRSGTINAILEPILSDTRRRKSSLGRPRIPPRIPQRKLPRSHLHAI
jgi:hypothetical protein